jgi:hypothetical protein
LVGRYKIIIILNIKMEIYIIIFLKIFLPPLKKTNAPPELFIFLN